MRRVAVQHDGRVADADETLWCCDLQRQHQDAQSARRALRTFPRPTGKSVRRLREPLSSPFCKNILIFRRPKSGL
jgi:hypothetical protein